MKILIADDDVISCRALQKQAEEWGYKVYTAHNGEDAWKIIRKNKIRLAVLDWKMPKMDGAEVCKKIRKHYEEHHARYTYIIMLTARSLKEERVRGLAAGIDDYMTKPASLVELKIRLKNGERILQLEDNRINLASFDGLTLVWNRSKILEFFEEELERGRRDGRPTGIIMADIDNFKAVNDTYGHFIGDKVLVEVTTRLKNSIRRYDKIGRFGGDEILIVLSNCRQDQLEQITDRLRQSVCIKEVKTKAGPIKTSVSLGAISSEAAPHATSSYLLQASDKALYKAKREGRNKQVIGRVFKKAASQATAS